MEEKTLRDEFAMSAPGAPFASIQFKEKNFPDWPATWSGDQLKLYESWSNGYLASDRIDTNVLKEFTAYRDACDLVLLDNDREKRRLAAQVQADWAYFYADAMMERRKV